MSEDAYNLKLDGKTLCIFTIKLECLFLFFIWGSLLINRLYKNILEIPLKKF